MANENRKALVWRESSGNGMFSLRMWWEWRPRTRGALARILEVLAGAGGGDQFYVEESLGQQIWKLGWEGGGRVHGKIVEGKRIPVRINMAGRKETIGWF